MLPDRVSNPGPLTYESGALPNVGKDFEDRLEPLFVMQCDLGVHI